MSWAAAVAGRGIAVAGLAPMPVEALDVRVFATPARDGVRMSFGPMSARRLCLVEVRAGSLIGRGESWVNYPDWAWVERVATLREGITPLLTGLDARDPSAVHARLAAALEPLGRQWGAPGPIWQALSGVDIALWDLLGQAAGRPVSALLSEHPRPRVPAYASGIGPDSVGELTERAMLAGFNALKVKVGFGREHDVRTLATVRAAAGPGVRIFADANQAWTLDEATEMCLLLAEHGIEWCEEPIAGGALADLETLHERTAMPLAVGENLYGLADFRRHLASPATMHLQPDVSKTGGITLAAALDPPAAAHRTAISPHCYGAAPCLLATVQLAVGLGALGWVELDIRDNPLRTELIGEPFEIRDGHITVPVGPGLGAVLDERALIRYSTNYTQGM